MGKPTGFLEYHRETSAAEAPLERIKHFHEFHSHLPMEEQQKTRRALYGVRRAVLPVWYDNCRHDFGLSAA